MNIPKILLEGSVSQFFDLGPSFYFMTKTGNVLPLFSLQNSTFHSIITRA